MTKAQFAGEPSMDDILASIRKMIAEEPAGPRPVPDQITRTVFTGNAPQVQGAVEQPDRQAVESIDSPQSTASNYSRLSDALADAAPANEPQQNSLENRITQLLGDRAAPAHGSAAHSNPLADSGSGQHSQPGSRTPERANAFDSASSNSKEGTVPFGHRGPEARALSNDKADSTESNLGRAGSPAGAKPFDPVSVAAQRDEPPLNSKNRASETRPDAPVFRKPVLRRASSVAPSEPSNPNATPKMPSLVASLEKARAESASGIHEKNSDEPPVSGFEAPAPEAVAAALLEKSGARLAKGDARPPAVGGANISPFGSRPKLADARSAQPEAPRPDADVTREPREALEQSGSRAGDVTTRALKSGTPKTVGLGSSQNASSRVSERESAKASSATPPSEALLDAVVDMVKNEPASLSVFTSGSAFIHGVADDKKSVASGAPPAKLDKAAAELLRPMLRQWLSENMPRIVEEALRSELDSSQQTGQGADKA